MYLIQLCVNSYFVEIGKEINNKKKKYYCSTIKLINYNQYLLNPRL